MCIIPGDTENEVTKKEKECITEEYTHFLKKGLSSTPCSSLPSVYTTMNGPFGSPFVPLQIMNSGKVSLALESVRTFI